MIYNIYILYVYIHIWSCAIETVLKKDEQGNGNSIDALPAYPFCDGVAYVLGPTS